MAPFRALATPLIDMVGPMPYPAMYQLTAEGEQPGPGVAPVVVRAGSQRAGDRRDRRAPLNPQPVMGFTQLRVLGGAMGRVPAGATAFAHRDAVGDGHRSSPAPSEARYAEAVAWADAYQADLSDGSTGVYSNFLADEGATRLHQAYPGATYERLVQVKRRVDPENLFRGNHNIRPD